VWLFGFAADCALRARPPAQTAAGTGLFVYLIANQRFAHAGRTPFLFDMSAVFILEITDRG
jgi:hypothetical protein